MAAQPRLLVISGPSGVGKGTLVAELLKRRPDFCRSVSVTTRKPRPGECEGIDYHFVSDSTFDALIAKGELLEWAAVHDARYGTPRSAVDKALQAGQSVVLEIDVQGAKAIKAQRPDALLVFVKPPSFATLNNRLIHRATEDQKTRERRLAAAKHELNEASSFDAQVINDDLATATNELLSLL